jgi:cellulose synthase (UDP-forming)
MILEPKDTSVRSEKVFTCFDYLTFTVLTVLASGAIVHFMAQWLANADWARSLTVFWGLTFIGIGKLASIQLRWWYLPFMKRPKPMAVRSGWKVGVATTFVPGEEPIEMLEQTVRALIDLEYPHETWVLDEGNDIRVAALCAELGAFHFSRKNYPHYQTRDGVFQARSKHGNYNAWLHEVGFKKYDVITAFDPDHVPQAAFLSEVLGYFNDPNVGYVQAPQAYYNQRASFIARGAAEETYGYYSATQMFGYSIGCPIATGCHSTHRVTALKEVGGFPAHDAEDLLITLLYRSAGWRGVYVPKILARGLTPVDWAGYLKQQLRWARSVLDIKFRIYPKIAGKLPVKERVTSFMHGLFYLQPMVVAAGLVLLAYMLMTGSVPPAALNHSVIGAFCLLVATLVFCEFFRQRFYLDRRNEWGWHWRAGLLQLAKWPYFLLAVYQVLSKRRFPYLLTSKVRARAQAYVLLPHVFVAELIFIAWIVGALKDGSLHPLLHLSAAGAGIGSLVVAATERMAFPDPYDPSLLTRDAPSSLKTDELRDVNAHYPAQGAS